jgi:hypothetical protein
MVTLTPVADATLYLTADGSVANGAGGFTFIGNNSQGQTRRTLLRFDVAGALPSGVVVTEVTLTMHVASGDTADAISTLHRVLGAWGEGPSDPPNTEGQGAASMVGDSTWLHTFYSDSFWQTPGGDFDGAASASAIVNGAGSYTWSGQGLVDDVQAWLDGVHEDHGWILRGDESVEGTARRLASRQNTEASLQPTLTISYLVPAPGGSACLLCAGALGLRRRRRADNAPSPHRG